MTHMQMLLNCLVDGQSENNSLELKFGWELGKSCFFDEYPMVQAWHPENVNLHAYRFGTYFFRKCMILQQSLISHP